jgi:hypothetical protein
MDGERVYWAEVSGSSNAEQVNIRGCRITDCQPKTLLTRTAFPATANGTVYGWNDPRYRRDTRNGTSRIISVTSSGQQLEIVSTAPDNVEAAGNGLVAAGTHLAWVTARRGADWFDILDLGTGRHLRLTSETDGGFGYPVLTNRFAMVAESSGVAKADVAGYLYDLDKDHLFSVGNSSGLYGLLGAGDILKWEESEGRGPEKPIETVVAELR